MAKEELHRVLTVGQDGSVQTLVKDGEGQDQLVKWKMYLTDGGTPVYKKVEDPGIDQEGDPFNKPKVSVRERWAGVDQPIGE